MLHNFGVWYVFIFLKPFFYAENLNCLWISQPRRTT